MVSRRIVSLVHKREDTKLWLPKLMGFKEIVRINILKRSTESSMFKKCHKHRILLEEHLIFLSKGPLISVLRVQCIVCVVS
jgi:hypothetical protein